MDEHGRDSQSDQLRNGGRREQDSGRDYRVASGNRLTEQCVAHIAGGRGNRASPLGVGVAGYAGSAYEGREPTRF